MIYSFNNLVLHSSAGSCARACFCWFCSLQFGADQYYFMFQLVYFSFCTATKWINLCWMGLELISISCWFCSLQFGADQYYFMVHDYVCGCWILNYVGLLGKVDLNECNGIMILWKGYLFLEAQWNSHEIIQLVGNE